MKATTLLFVKKMTAMEVKLTFVLAVGFEIYSLRNAFGGSITHFLFTFLLLILLIALSIRILTPRNAKLNKITLIGACKCVIFTSLETAIWTFPVVIALEWIVGLTPFVQIGIQSSAIILYCIFLWKNRSLDWQHEGPKPSEVR